MSDDIPQWALDRASRLTRDVCEHRGGNLEYFSDWREAFARYIAAHEQPPVDPLLIEARKIAAEQFGHRPEGADFLAGKFDDTASITALVAALKRGMELAK